MPVFVVGANYRSAPLELLERLAVDPERRPKALAGLLDLEHAACCRALYWLVRRGELRVEIVKGGWFRLRVFS